MREKPIYSEDCDCLTGLKSPDGIYCTLFCDKASSINDYCVGNGNLVNKENNSTMPCYKIFNINTTNIREMDVDHDDFRYVKDCISYNDECHSSFDFFNFLPKNRDIKQSVFFHPHYREGDSFVVNNFPLTFLKPYSLENRTINPFEIPIARHFIGIPCEDSEISIKCKKKADAFVSNSEFCLIPEKDSSFNLSEFDSYILFILYGLLILFGFGVFLIMAKMLRRMKRKANAQYDRVRFINSGQEDEENVEILDY